MKWFETFWPENFFGLTLNLYVTITSFFSHTCSQVLLIFFVASAIFTITAVIIPEAVTGFRTDDLCIRLVFTCDHSNPKNIRSQCIVVISTALVAIITMVTSYTIILRVIRTSEKWRNSYGMQSNSQTRRNAVLVRPAYRNYRKFLIV